MSGIYMKPITTCKNKQQTSNTIRILTNYDTINLFHTSLLVTNENFNSLPKDDIQSNIFPNVKSANLISVSQVSDKVCKSK